MDKLEEEFAEAIYDFLEERFPGGALPGGTQIFADDHLDAEFKHEAGCDALAERLAVIARKQVEELKAALSTLVEAAEPAAALRIADRDLRNAVNTARAALSGEAQQKKGNIK